MTEPHSPPNLLDPSAAAGPLARKLASRILYEALFAAFDQDTLGHGTHFSGPGSATRSMEQLLEGAALGLERLSRRVELQDRGAIETEMLLLFPIFAANHVDAVIELCARNGAAAEPSQSPRGAKAAAQSSAASFALSSLPSLRSAASLGSDFSPDNFMLQPVSPPRRPSRKPHASPGGLGSAANLPAAPAASCGGCRGGGVAGAEGGSPRQPHRGQAQVGYSRPKTKESRNRSISPRWRVGGAGFAAAPAGPMSPPAQPSRPQLSPQPPPAPADPAVARYMDADGRVLVADGKGRIAWRMVGGAPGSLGSRRVPLRVHALVVEKGRDTATALFASSFRLFLVPALSPGAGTPPPRNFYESVAEIWPGVSCVSLRATDTFDSIVCPLPDAELTLILISDLDRVSIPLVLAQPAPATPRRWILPRTAAAFSFGSYSRVCVALSVPGPVEIDTASALPTTSIDVFSLARLLNA
jgi:hypothetical protein